MIELENSTVFFKNRFVPFSDANLSIASSPVLYGVSIYTVFPVNVSKDGKLLMFRLEDHFKRLKNSAQIMDFHNFLDGWNFEKFCDVMQELIKRNKISQDSLLRVSVFVDEILSGTRLRGLKHELSAFIYPFKDILPAAGCHVCVSSWMRTPDNAIPSRAKINGSYTNAALMKNEALANGYDDAISLDSHGHVAESTVANIFMVRDGELVTPGSSTDLLEGLTRDTILTLATSHGINFTQRSIDRSELYLAQEIFFSGSSARITPVLSVDKRPVGSGRVGQITKHLAETYDAISHGNDANFETWLTAVN